MEFFRMLVKAIGDMFTAENDPIARLPVEISEIIFRQLDPQSLLNAARVSKKWRAVCSGDSKLRDTAKCHLLKEKRQLLKIESPTGRRKILMRKPVHNTFKISFQRHAAAPVSFFYDGSSGVTHLGAMKSRERREYENSSMPKRITTRFR